MRFSARLSARTLCLGLAAATALGLSPGIASASTAPPAPGRLSAQARAAGLTAAGGGEMGWRSRLSSGRVQPAPAAAGSSVAGIDVSSYQGDVDWASYYNQGKRFAYVKATEGSSYTNPSFTSQYDGSAAAGLVRGAYHFANPGGASGATQATYFVDHGGAWTGDGKTLPGALDIEYNPYDGGTCYGLTHKAMISWIRSFVTKFKTLTGRNVVIYTTTDWWTTCTGNTSQFSTTTKLWIARYASSPGTLPKGWSAYTFWQYSSDPIDQDRYPGTLTALKAYAKG